MTIRHDVENNNDTHNMIEAIKEISTHIASNGNYTVSEKLDDLVMKALANDAYVAFCGHFSAGKSTLINTLLSQIVLPSSPIPTSANVVRIQSGDPGVTIHFKEREDLQLGLEQLEELQHYCKAGDIVSSVDIFTETSFLPNNISLLDTPGIDSTDEAHQLATTSALHLADVVFYVMDYNHVQSEINFHFAKSLLDQGKPLYMVVNQIDKHNPLELSFSDFAEGVKKGFEAWDITPAHIFFVSMRDQTHPYNEFELLKDTMNQLLQNPSSWVVQTVKKAALQLIEEHKQWQVEQQQGLRSVIEDRRSLSEGYVVDKEKLHELRKEKVDREQAPFQMEKTFKNEMKSLLENAPIFPYSTTELARLYVESRRSGFRVGLFFSKDKTTKEISDRLERFETELDKHVTAHIIWHMKELLIKIPKQWGIVDVLYEEKIRNLTFEWDRTVLSRLIKEGETSRDYIYRYTQEVGQEIKRESIRVGLTYLEQAKQYLHGKILAELSTLNETMNGAKANVEAWEQLIRLDEELTKEHDDLVNQLPEIAEQTPIVIGSIDLDKYDNGQRDEASELKIAHLSHTRLGMEEDTRDIMSNEQYEIYRRKGMKEAKKLRAASNIFSTITGLQRTSKSLLERAERMENRRFTVALFGAFSAGKSSLANALLGYPVLPVSPHPTTAVINRIVPPTADYQHGHVRVTLKTVDTMTKDVTEAFRTIGISVQSLEDALSRITDIDDAAKHAAMKPHVSFLHAFNKGYELFKNQLGSILETDVEHFSTYVANEDQACFVELVDVYYDCPLTRIGMTLVDTPGADSINARHTGVAFDYIKNADAVLFVTYYNHAFSNADRQFLNQLGRVKDTFEMDKMFFLVNAADLAQSEQELADVVNHVSENLQHHGIRHPRIYPVSSQTALWAKLLQSDSLGYEGERQYRLRTTGDLSTPLMPVNEALSMSGMKSFEDAFYAFTVEELTEIAISAAHADVERAMKRIDEWIASSQEDFDDRMRKRTELEKSHLHALDYVKLAPVKSQVLAMEQEIDELAFYVKQRIGFKFSEMFNASFNGSDLIEDGRSMKKALQYCLRDLLGQLGLETLQELRTTALRIENYVRRLIKDVLQHWHTEINQFFPVNEWHIDSTGAIDVPDFLEHVKNLELASFHSTLTLFKNSKQFFEGNGKSQMRDALEKELTEPIDEEIKAGKECLKQHYGNFILDLVDQLKQEVIHQIEDDFAGLMVMYGEAGNIAEIQESRNKLAQLLEEG